VTYRVYYAPDKEPATGNGVGPTGELARGVQAIVQDHPEVGVEIVTSCDYYVYEDGRWRGVDIFGLFDYLLDSGLVLFGRTIKRKEYYQVMQQVQQDKAGWLPRERQE
jgi:hypothetical protein